MLKLPYGNAICYSGYRRGQSPGERLYPSLAEIREDLHILHKNWRLLRLYDCSVHAERVLEVIRRDRLDFQVMLGAHLGAEMNNFGCPWGATYSEEQLEANVAENDAEVERLITLARHNDDIVFSVAVGNEATVDWTDHFVPVERMIQHVRRVKDGVPQPVTFCENYVPWREKLRDLVRELDFISLHTYPVWEYKHVHDALHYSKDNYHSVASLYPDKPVVISEAGLGDELERARHQPRELVAGTAGDLLPGPDGVDQQRAHPDFRVRGIRRALEGFVGPIGAREALGPVHRGSRAEDRHAAALRRTAASVAGPHEAARGHAPGGPPTDADENTPRPEHAADENHIDHAAVRHGRVRRPGRSCQAQAASGALSPRSGEPAAAGRAHHRRFARKHEPRRLS